MNDAESTPPKGFVRTLVVAVAVALVCSTAVTTAVQYLRPVQAAYSNLARTTAIVRTAYGPITTEAQIVEDFLALQIVYFDTTTRTLVSGAAGVPSDHILPVYLRREPDTLVFVFPVTAKGMWSDIDCYIALDANANTIVRLEIFEHGETPGIGDKIEEPQWLSRFTGKNIYDVDGLARLYVGKDATVAAQHRVDAISGATISSVAIGAALQSAFGSGGFAAVRAQLVEEFRISANGDNQ